ncbi:MAG TPA: hypothetical protein VK577_24580 [Bradyrhizobium sp.]|jgi:hypothetical protein|nr:hypothetical protein [Bradyrhizobium sp.]
MIKLKLLSAGLIAVALFAAPAMAREHQVTSRHLAEGASIQQGAPYVDGYSCVPAPRVGAFATQPWDNAAPCEPMTGY